MLVPYGPSLSLSVLGTGAEDPSVSPSCNKPLSAAEVSHRRCPAPQSRLIGRYRGHRWLYFARRQATVSPSPRSRRPSPACHRIAGTPSTGCPPTEGTGMKTSVMGTGVGKGLAGGVPVVRTGVGVSTGDSWGRITPARTGVGATWENPMERVVASRRSPTTTIAGESHRGERIVLLP